MILESGQILAIEADRLQVETISRSACGSCKAQSGCGQSMLAKWGGSASKLWVSLEGRDAKQFRVGDQIQIGVAEDVMARGALLIYAVPLLCLVAASFLAHKNGLGDGATAACAFAGLLIGGAIVNWRSRYSARYSDKHLQPVLVDAKAVQIIPACEQE